MLDRTSTLRFKPFSPTNHAGAASCVPHPIVGRSQNKKRKIVPVTLRKGPALSLALVLLPPLAAAPDSGAREFFEMRVRPLLAKNCFACHTASRMGGLEMSGREAFLK